MPTVNLEDFNFSTFEGKSENEIYNILSNMSGALGGHKLIVFTLKAAGFEVDPNFYEYFVLCGPFERKCQRCGRPGRPRLQNTSYNDEKMNWAILCDECQEEADEYWAGRWAEYWANRL